MIHSENVNIINNYQTNIVGPSNYIDLEFLNTLFAIYYESWKSSKVFEELLLKEIYISANKDRSKAVSEIQVLKMTFHGSAPELFRLEKLPCDAGDVSLVYGYNDSSCTTWTYR